MLSLFKPIFSLFQHSILLHQYFPLLLLLILLAVFQFSFHILFLSFDILKSIFRNKSCIKYYLKFQVFFICTIRRMVPYLFVIIFRLCFARRCFILFSFAIILISLYFEKLAIAH